MGLGVFVVSTLPYLDYSAPRIITDFSEDFPPEEALQYERSRLVPSSVHVCILE